MVILDYSTMLKPPLIYGSRVIDTIHTCFGTSLLGRFNEREADLCVVSQAMYYYLISNYAKPWVLLKASR